MPRFRRVIPLLAASLLTAALAAPKNPPQRALPRQPQNTTKSTLAAVFAPYIALKRRHQAGDSTHEIAPPPSLSDVSTVDPVTHMTEADMRATMLAKPSKKKSKPRPYASGHTFLPTVRSNITWPRPQPQHKTPPKDAQQAMSQERLANHSAPPSDAVVAAMVGQGIGRASHAAPPRHQDPQHSNPHNRDTKKEQDNVEELGDHSVEVHNSAAHALDALRAHHPGFFQGSIALPAAIFGALVWACVMAARKTGLFKSKQQRRARALGKRMLSAKMVV